MIKHLNISHFLHSWIWLFCTEEVLQNKWCCVSGAEGGSPLC